MGVWDAYVQLIVDGVPKIEHMESGSMNFVDFEFVAQKAHEVSRLGYRINTLDYDEKDKAYIYVNLYVDQNTTGRLIVEYTNVDTFSKKRQISQPRMWLLGLSGHALDIINKHLYVLSSSDSYNVHNVLVKYLAGMQYVTKIENKVLSTSMLPEEIADFYLWKDVYCRTLSKKDAREVTKYVLSKDKNAVGKDVVRKFLTALFVHYSSI